MTVRSAGHRARLTGVGCTRFGEILGSSWLSLHADAAREALADAGLVKADVDEQTIIPDLADSWTISPDSAAGLRPVGRQS